MNTVANEPTAAPATEGADAGSGGRSAFLALMLGSVGVVYGDIGTSPLYAFREATVAAAAGGAVTRSIVLGVL
jgi:KUP system potassium uptake protein